MSASRQRPDQAIRFLPWMRQNGLDDWRQLMAQAYPEIETMAREAGIDWPALSLRLPACGTFLKGHHVPVLEKRDQGRCAFVWHLNSDSYGNRWPCLVFMSFRQGGVHQIFHGYRWAWLVYRTNRGPQGVKQWYYPQARLETARQQTTRASHAAQDEAFRLQRFLNQTRRWMAASQATPAHPLLQKRLCGHATSELLMRVHLRAFEHARGEGLMVRLHHHQHGHCGFQLLYPTPLDARGRTQHLIIRQSGMKRGAFVCISAAPGHADWPIGICEGVFTALSVALGWPGPIAVALDAGNLSNVRRMISRNCVFFADNDLWGAHNTGLKRATQALQSGDQLVVPHFSETLAGEHPTDFNDLLRLAGRDELLRQLLATWPNR